MVQLASSADHPGNTKGVALLQGRCSGCAARGLRHAGTCSGGRREQALQVQEVPLLEALLRLLLNRFFCPIIQAESTCMFIHCLGGELTKPAFGTAGEMHPCTACTFHSNCTSTSVYMHILGSAGATACAGHFCNDACLCMDCQNRTSSAPIVFRARTFILARDITAFQPKVLHCAESHPFHGSVISLQAFSWATELCACSNNMMVLGQHACQPILHQAVKLESCSACMQGLQW